jgi:hypothetical protein
MPDYQKSKIYYGVRAFYIYIYKTRCLMQVFLSSIITQNYC